MSSRIPVMPAPRFARRCPDRGGLCSWFARCARSSRALRLLPAAGRALQLGAERPEQLQPALLELLHALALQRLDHVVVVDAEPGQVVEDPLGVVVVRREDRKSKRLNSSHVKISY